MNTDPAWVSRKLKELAKGETRRRTRVGIAEFFRGEKHHRFFVFGATQIGNSPWAVIYSEESKKDEIVYVDCLDREKVMKSAVCATRLKHRASKAFETFKHTAPAVSNTAAASNNASLFAGIRSAQSPQVVQTPSALYTDLFRAYALKHDPCPVKPLHDAMMDPWGARNFVNPPFRYMSGFFFRACELARQNGAYSVFLVPAPFKTCWFAEVVRSGCVLHITFLRWGLCFQAYDKPCPLELNLVHIGPGGARPGGGGEYTIPSSFYDPVDRKRLASLAHLRSLPTI